MASRQLKELRNLMPWTWDARVEDHPPGQAAMRDFQDAFSWTARPTRKAQPAAASPSPACPRTAPSAPSTAKKRPCKENAQSQSVKRPSRKLARTGEEDCCRDSGAVKHRVTFEVPSGSSTPAGGTLSCSPVCQQNSVLPTEGTKPGCAPNASTSQEAHEPATLAIKRTPQIESTPMAPRSHLLMTPSSAISAQTPAIGLASRSMSMDLDTSGKEGQSAHLGSAGLSQPRFSMPMSCPPAAQDSTAALDGGPSNSKPHCEDQPVSDCGTAGSPDAVVTPFTFSLCQASSMDTPDAKGTGPKLIRQTPATRLMRCPSFGCAITPGTAVAVASGGTGATAAAVEFAARPPAMPAVTPQPPLAQQPANAALQPLSATSPKGSPVTHASSDAELPLPMDLEPSRLPDVVNADSAGVPADAAVCLPAGCLDPIHAVQPTAKATITEVAASESAATQLAGLAQPQPEAMPPPTAMSGLVLALPPAAPLAIEPSFVSEGPSLDEEMSALFSESSFVSNEGSQRMILPHHAVAPVRQQLPHFPVGVARDLLAPMTPSMLPSSNVLQAAEPLDLHTPAAPTAVAIRRRRTRTKPVTAPRDTLRVPSSTRQPPRCPPLFCAAPTRHVSRAHTAAAPADLSIWASDKRKAATASPADQARTVSGPIDANVPVAAAQHRSQGQLAADEAQGVAGSGGAGAGREDALQAVLRAHNVLQRSGANAVVRACARLRILDAKAGWLY